MFTNFILTLIASKLFVLTNVFFFFFLFWSSQELYVRVNLWEKAEEERLAAEQDTVTSRMMKRIGSIHLPEGLNLPMPLALPGTGTGRTSSSGRSSPTSDDDSRNGGGANRRASTGAVGRGSGAANGAGAAHGGRRLPSALGASSSSTGNSGSGPLSSFGGVLRMGNMGKAPSKN